NVPNLLGSGNRETARRSTSGWPRAMRCPTPAAGLASTSSRRRASWNASIRRMHATSCGSCSSVSWSECGSGDVVERHRRGAKDAQEVRLFAGLLTSLHVGQDGTHFVDEVVDILELPIDTGKADVSHFVQTP